MKFERETRAIQLSEYAPPPFLVERVDLTFMLDPAATRVRARISFTPSPERSADGPHDLLLDGRGLTLISAEIDGDALPEDAFTRDDERLSVAAAHVPKKGFIWTCETTISPKTNTALEGLYMSKGMYCTQCEAEGFRKITFYPDRPDVMAVCTVRVEGDAPVLLSNGNLTGAGDGWAEWHDPHPKPSYLFALVAGDLVAVEDRFRTVSGRDVLLQIWVRTGDEDRCGYAMDALQRSMRWDEEVYGREYDLDRFMIVAVDDFNMGAMENKGLNVFNSKYVLASPETATDADYANIEAIIAHEYFHNWTGNRITCRDWFQLCLKEGLTVYRDQQFSGDMRSHGVKRIEDVMRLRAQQFREDAGPLAHPVRPSEYVEINNFYTATVYEKGAELIGMLRLLIGEDAWRAGLDLYFERHDGQACTIEDWLACFAQTSGRDLGQYARWYSQAGTPHVAVTEEWDGARYSLTLEQRTPPTPGQREKMPLVIPVACGLLGPDGSEASSAILELTEARQTFEWELDTRPTASLLRGFSAPVVLEREMDAEGRAFLLAHDPDPFNRWEAGRDYAMDLLARRAADPATTFDAHYLDAMRAVAEDEALDPALKALTLGLPPEDEIIGHVARTGDVPDPLAVHAARRGLEAAVAGALGSLVAELYATNRVDGPYTPDAGAAGRRALRGRALALMTALDPEAREAAAAFAAADNMTERMQALGLLVGRGGGGGGGEALETFHSEWKDDRLVLDKWFAVQATRTPPGTAVETVKALTRHPDFDWLNPNRFRSLIGGFALGNPAGLHRADGAGYALVVDWLIRLDPLNPQTTARLATALGTWRLFDSDRQAKMRAELERLAALPGLSRDTADIVGRLLDRTDA